MMIKIYGASDDLIEVDGDITEEWGAYDAGKQYVAVSDGTLLTIEYDDHGIWRVNVIVRGTGEVSMVYGDIEQDTNDVVTIDGHIRWVLVGEDVALPHNNALR